MREIRPSGLEGGVRLIPHPYPYRNIEHRTSNIQHPISKGGAKPPKATAKPYSRHILGIDSGVQSHPKATLKRHQSATKAPPRRHQSHPKATSKPPPGDPQAACFLICA